jgi:L-methionine (R)-S-oxide reductase
MKYKDLLESAEALLKSQPNLQSILANGSAFLNDMLDDLNWVGFYLFDGDALTVGPFQGKVACAHIPLGKGVCGEAAIQRKTLVVDDVHAIDNHIVCDAQSQSEVVVPIFVHDQLFGVLDVDSPSLSRFDQETVVFLESFVKLLVKIIDNMKTLM